MLGIFLIICLAVFWVIEMKAYRLSRDNYSEPVKIDSNVRTYDICHRAMVLHAVSQIVILTGYIGCAWPYLFVEGIDRGSYIEGIVIFGFVPILSLGYVCYSIIRSAQGRLKISTDEIEYKGRKCFTIKVIDIKKITYLGRCLYRIHQKEKGKKPIQISLIGFNKRKEACSLMNQLMDYSARLTGYDKSLSYKLCFPRFVIVLSKYFFTLYLTVIGLLLVYASYGCIDYDFFRKDYTALFNALDAEPNEAENAWPYYVKAAVNYREMEEELQGIICCSKSSQIDFNDNDINNLQKWFNENALSWESLKKATNINYCNVYYKHISFPLLADSMVRNDFSNPFDTRYCQIRNLYSNINTCRLAGVLDLNWFDLFEMQIGSAKHFVNGKSFMDQLAGYAMLGKSIKLFTEQNNYKIEDLEMVRGLLKERFPAGVPPLSIEGEILIMCSSFDDLVNIKKIPVQTPLNPVFLIFGSVSGEEAYARKHFIAILEQARKGIETESKGFSILSFPIGRNMCFSILEPGISKVYKTSQRAGANLLAAYVILDLEEYKLAKGCYPEDVSQLREAGLTSQIPDDPDTDGKKIIYRNDGKRAILYAVGPNGRDDCGYKDEKGVDRRDDIIYWQRDSTEKGR